MQFLYPSVLWALTALIVPLIIHLFNFRRYQVLPFSNVQFIRVLQTKHESRSQIRNLFILLLRILILTFVVFAFAQPFLPNENNELSVNPRVAVYIDNSFSMDADGQYGSLIERAKTCACELTETFPPQTEYLLLTNNVDLQQLRWVSRSQFTDWVQKVQTTHIVANLEDVLMRQKIIATDTMRQLYSFIFSDLHKQIIKAGDVKPMSNQRVFLIPMQNNAQNNLAIDSLWFSSPGLYVGKIEEVTVRVRNYGNEDIRNVNIQIIVNDSLKNTASFSVDANSSTDVKCSFLQSKQGWNIGKVTIQDFPITFDNQLFFCYNILPQTKVLNLSSSSETDYFSILYSNDKAISYEQMLPLKLSTDKISDYQTIILNSVKLSSGLTQLLEQYVMAGGTIILLPSDNQKFDEFMSITGGPKIGEWIGSAGMATNLNIKHNIFKNAIISNQKNISLPTYKGYFQVKLNSRQMVERLMNTEQGDLLAFNYKHGKGMIYVLATPFDTENTNLMTHQIFVPLFYNIALQSSNATQLYTIIQNNMQVVAGNLNSTKALSMVSELGMIMYPEKRETTTGTMLYPNAMELSAGVYSLYDDNNFVGNVAFNFDRAESVQKYLSVDYVSNILKNNGFDVVVSEDKNHNFAQNFDFADTKLWRLFALLALICLVLETFLICLKS